MSVGTIVAACATRDPIISDPLINDAADGTCPVNADCKIPDAPGTATDAATADDSSVNGFAPMAPVAADIAACATNACGATAAKAVNDGAKDANPLPPNIPPNAPN